MSLTVDNKLPASTSFYSSSRDAIDLGEIFKRILSETQLSQNVADAEYTGP